MVSNALVPHKDTLFMLASIQRKFIAASKEAGIFLIPQYPLWAFFDSKTEPLIEKLSSVTKCQIQKPEHDDTGFFFPVTLAIEDDASTQTHLRIVFATWYDTDKKAFDLPSLEESNAFPFAQRVFRIGTATRQDNGWALTDDQWIKLQ